jgi:hypothetical protein
VTTPAVTSWKLILHPTNKGLLLRSPGGSTPGSRDGAPFDLGNRPESVIVNLIPNCFENLVGKVDNGHGKGR